MGRALVVQLIACNSAGREFVAQRIECLQPANIMLVAQWEECWPSPNRVLVAERYEVGDATRVLS